MTDTNADLRRRIFDAECELAFLRRQRPAGEPEALQAAQSRADNVAALYGDRVSGPTTGEGELGYRRRLLRGFMQHSPQFKSAHVEAMDSAMLGLVENQVYADAATAARNTANAQPGVLIPRVSTDAAGRRITKYDGDMSVWLAPFAADGARCVINRKGS
jgi:hypothetical protein